MHKASFRHSLPAVRATASSFCALVRPIGGFDFCSLLLLLQSCVVVVVVFVIVVVAIIVVQLWWWQLLAGVFTLFVGLLPS